MKITNPYGSATRCQTEKELKEVDFKADQFNNWFYRNDLAVPHRSAERGY